MLVICPRYNSYSSMNAELRSRTKHFMINVISKFGFDKKPTIFLEDELAVKLFGEYCDIVTLTQESDLSIAKVSEYLDLYTNEFVSKYNSYKHIKPFDTAFTPLRPSNYKDKDAYINARRKQYRDRLSSVLEEYLDKQKVIIQFVQKSNVSSWVPKVEHSIGDGRAIITVDLTDLTYTCYYGGIFMSEVDMRTVLEQIM